jgi:hypothetical protein
VAAGTGNVTKVGTPVNNQLGVWTGDGTIEGDADLTWDGGLSITVDDTENKKGLVIYQNDVTNKPLALQVGADAARVTAYTSVQFNDEAGQFSDWSFRVAANNTPYINLMTHGGTLASPAASSNGDIPGLVDFIGKDSANNNQSFAQISVVIDDVTSGSEDGRI